MDRLDQRVCRATPEAYIRLPNKEPVGPAGQRPGNAQIDDALYV
jgi:hypothetical protein